MMNEELHPVFAVMLGKAAIEPHPQDVRELRVRRDQLERVQREIDRRQPPGKESTAAAVTTFYKLIGEANRLSRRIAILEARTGGKA